MKGRAVFPAKAYLAQRRHRDDVAAQVAMLSADNRALEDRATQLGTDAETERLARQYNLIKPGEEQYFIIPRNGPPTTVAPPPPPVKHPSPSLWDRIAGIF